jgi:hypothetical protein
MVVATAAFVQQQEHCCILPAASGLAVAVVAAAVRLGQLLPAGYERFARYVSSLIAGVLLASLLLLAVLLPAPAALLLLLLLLLWAMCDPGLRRNLQAPNDLSVAA